MDDKKKKRLAALKKETAEGPLHGERPAPKKNEKTDMWGTPIVKRKPSSDDIFAEPSKPWKVTGPEPNSAIAAPTKPPEPIAAKPELAKEPKSIVQALPVERIKIYNWSDGYYLASGKRIDADSPEYLNAERFKVFHPPNKWIARTEDGTKREYEIAVEFDIWDTAELKRVNKIKSHAKQPIIINPYGVR